MPKSEARRTAEALEAALEHVKTASHVAGQHRHRGSGGSVPQHISDVHDLCATLETVHYLTHYLAKVVKSVADDARAHYVNGTIPDAGGEWPDNVKQAAATADQTLSTLRSYLDKTPASGGHDALLVLHAVLQNLHRATKSPK